MNVLMEVFSAKLSKGHSAVEFLVSSLTNLFVIDAYDENSYNARTLLISKQIA